MPTKQQRHEMTRTRAARAILDMCHNATPRYPHDAPDDHQDTFSGWFEDAASYEIDYIQSGGAHAKSENAYRKILEENATRKLKSEAARRCYVRKGLRDMREARAKYGAWERINECGKLYQWGRGGRTLAPGHLVKQRGGSSFSLREDYPSECTIAECVDLIRIVESFNAYVAAWCKDVPDMWKEYFAENYGGADIDATAELSTTD